MASKKQGTKKDEGKSLKSKNTVKTIDQMTVARQIAEKFGFKLSDILAVIEEERTFTMQQFAEAINAFLSFRQYKILQGKGTVSKLDAERKANHEYEIFNKTQKITSDFDKEVKRIMGKKDDVSQN